MSARAPSILLVEDSETQALQLSALLRGEGFAVDRAQSAEAALDHLSGALPDLLMVDYHLPGMNGDELVRLVRMNGQTRSLPVMMLTGGSGPALERQGLDSGASAYVAKSAERALLLGRVRALLRQRRAEADTAGAPGLRRAVMLLVTDSAATRAAFEPLLAAEAYRAETLPGPDGLDQRLAAGRIDCLLIDLDATGFDGFDLARRLDRQRAGAAGYEIVALGSETGGGDIALRGFAAGADDMLLKSEEHETLIARLRAVVRRKFARDEEARAAEHERERETALAMARAEAAGAEALAAANRELAAANERLSTAQAQLVQAAKMASLGELVAGIAHEINNPLAFIIAHQATVRRLVGEAAAGNDRDAAAARLARAAERLDAMQAGLARIRELVVNLRRFSRLDEGERLPVDVPEAIDAVVALLGPKLGETIVVERDYAAPPTLVCSAALINQVVMNILANAADALPDGGRIAIATRLAGGGAGNGAGRYEIEIEDDGPGVPAEARPRIFEPFFTTKDVGIGTGLGLAIAYGVVRSHDGEIAIGDSRWGGARFTISIPASAE